MFLHLDTQFWHSSCCSGTVRLVTASFLEKCCPWVPSGACRLSLVGGPLLTSRQWECFPSVVVDSSCSLPSSGGFWREGEGRSFPSSFCSPACVSLLASLQGLALQVAFPGSVFLSSRLQWLIRNKSVCFSSSPTVLGGYGTLVTLSDRRGYQWRMTDQLVHHC